MGWEKVCYKYPHDFYNWVLDTGLLGRSSLKHLHTKVPILKTEVCPEIHFQFSKYIVVLRIKTVCTKI